MSERRSQFNSLELSTKLTLVQLGFYVDWSATNLFIRNQVIIVILITRVSVCITIVILLTRVRHTWTVILKGTYHKLSHDKAGNYQLIYVYVKVFERERAASRSSG